MHDDQHGTAIISAAALLNALEIQKKKIEKVKFVVNGAGAAAMACMQFICSTWEQNLKISLYLIVKVLFIKKERILMNSS